MEREITNKLQRMRELLVKSKDHSSGADSAHTIGIFSSLNGSKVKWFLDDVLKAKFFSGLVKTIKLIYIPEIGLKKLEKTAPEYTFCIYISSGQVKPPIFKKEVLHILERRSLMLVVKVQEDSSDGRKNEILKKEPDIKQYTDCLFLFSKAERKYDFHKVPPAGGGDWPTGQGVGTSQYPGQYNPPSHLTQDTDHYRGGDWPAGQGGKTSPYLGQYNPPSQQAQNTELYGRGSDAERSLRGPVGSRFTVGIFSRSSERDYSWLVGILKSEDFREQILDVQSCYISNNGLDQFMEDVSHCSLGILYHTKNRGRVNITDVPDPLYEDEIQYLSVSLGRDNVIVLVDDLSDSSDEVRTQILQDQTKITLWAKDLILISPKDKFEAMGQVAKLKMRRMFSKPGDWPTGQGVGTSRYPGPYDPPSQQQSYIEQYQREQREGDRPLAAHPAMPHLSAADHRQSMERKLSQQHKPLPMDMNPGLIQPTAKKRPIIGIISRSEEREYSWLRNLLLTQDVRDYTIAGNHSDALREAAYSCKYVLLYHSMSMGSIQTSDRGVTIYDDALERLSGKLGSRRVILVLDNMSNNSEKFKAEILNNFPNMKKWAADLFLFTAKEKKKIKTNDKILRIREILDLQ